MARAVANAATVRLITSPNPWVGAVVVGADGMVADGATRPPGGPHAEIVALRAAAAAGLATAGATLVTTLEPCSHTGRTGPCTEAIVAAGISRVVVALEDPDPLVAGAGLASLRAAGVEVVVGVGAAAAADQLAPYLHHRRTGRPYVVLKLAATLDGRTAAPDGTSQWITGPAARRDVHRLRAESDAVLVGAGTVRADDPALTVREWEPPPGVAARPTPPRRVVLGRAPAGARIHPCDERVGDLGTILSELGASGVVQLLVEGGATVARAFHAGGHVDRYVLYLAPALMGGDDGTALFAGAGVTTMADLWRGRILDVVQVGSDVRVELAPPGR